MALSLDTATPVVTTTETGSAEQTRDETSLGSPSLGLLLLATAVGRRVLAGEKSAVSADYTDLPELATFETLVGAVDTVVGWGRWGLSPTRRARARTRRFGTSLRSGVGKAINPLVRPLRRRGQAVLADSAKAGQTNLTVGLPATLEQVMEYVDLTEQAVTRIDFDRLLRESLASVDSVAIMADEVDLAALVAESLDRVDLTELALAKLDLQAVVSQTLADVDLPALVTEQLEPGRVADRVRAIDLDKGVAGTVRAMPADALKQVTDRVGRFRRPTS